MAEIIREEMDAEEPFDATEDELVEVYRAKESADRGTGEKIVQRAEHWNGLEK